MKQSSSPLFDPSHPLAHIGKKVTFALSLLIVVVLYYLARYSDGAEIIHATLQIPLWVIAAMVLVKGVYLWAQGGCFQGVYSMLGYSRPMTYLSLVYLGMNLVNTIAPSAGLSGMMYMMYLEKESGLKKIESVLINFFYYLIDYLIFLIFLLLALLYLLKAGEVTETILIASILFTLLVLGMGMLGIFLLSHPTAFHKVAGWGQRIWRSLQRKKQAEELGNRLREFVENSQFIWQKSRKSWRNLLKSAFFACWLHLSCLTLLWLAFYALGILPSAQVLLTGYTVGTLLNVVSITPAGIGFTEGGMTAVFALLGVPVEQALLVTLLYRSVFIWLPLFVGLPVINILPSLASKHREAPV